MNIAMINKQVTIIHKTNDQKLSRINWAIRMYTDQNIIIVKTTAEITASEYSKDILPSL